jgi:prenylcysteine oxidase/farnesylcysteine lyase
MEYKTIILAAPYHSTCISLPDSISSQIPEQPYVHLHVTLLTTTALHPNPVYFGLRPTDKVPNTILTTSQAARAGGAEPEFNSLTYHGTIEHDNKTEHVVKIFSKETRSDEWLANVFSDQVGWVLRKEVCDDCKKDFKLAHMHPAQWDAYPELPPTATFPPVKLDKGFFYVNAFEPFISTMETSTLAARNIVDIMLREEFGTGLCVKAAPPAYADSQGTEPEQEVLGALTPHEAETPGSDKDFVLGWDC